MRAPRNDCSLVLRQGYATGTHNTRARLRPDRCESAVCCRRQIFPSTSESSEFQRVLEPLSTPLRFPFAPTDLAFRAHPTDLLGAEDPADTASLSRQEEIVIAGCSCSRWFLAAINGMMRSFLRADRGGS